MSKIINAELDLVLKEPSVFDNEKIIALYTYESDLGDGWEDSSVHGNLESKRQEALKIGTNIIIYSLLR